MSVDVKGVLHGLAPIAEEVLAAKLAEMDPGLVSQIEAGAKKPLAELLAEGVAWLEQQFELRQITLVAKSLEVELHGPRDPRPD